MFSTFHGIEIGKKGLMANNGGLDTVGHNLANVETEGYSRQNVTQSAFIPLFEPTSSARSQTAGQVGTGVVIQDISRVRDEAIDERINNTMGDLGFWSMKQEYLEQIEVVYAEPGDTNLRTVLDDYWDSWMSVSADPTERAARVELVQRAQSVTDTVTAMYDQLRDLQNNADLLVSQKVLQINGIADELASLNVQIVQSEALGDNPNDLYDRRNLLIDDLAEQVNIKVEWSNENEVIVYIGSENLVQGGHYNELQLVGNPENEGFMDVTWIGGRAVELDGGELAGVISSRDDDLHTAIANLDALTVNLVSSTNEIHRDGFGLNNSTDVNFFLEESMSPYANGDYDFNNDGVIDGTAVFKMSGTEELTEETVIGTAGQLNFGPVVENGADITIDYVATDTIENVIDRINQSDADVSAYLTQNGQLTLKAKYPQDDGAFTPFVLNHVEDSGNLLVGIAGLLNQSGAAGAFDSATPGGLDQLSAPTRNIDFTPVTHASAWFAVNDLILADSDNVAAAGGLDTIGDGNPDEINGLGDNTNAQALANLRYEAIMVESETTVNEYFQAMVADMGTRAMTATTNTEENTAVVDSLQNLREEVSGVNVDEELTKMLMYQHGYNASARLVSTIDSMLETLMMMGA